MTDFLYFCNGNDTTDAICFPSLGFYRHSISLPAMGQLRVRSHKRITGTVTVYILSSYTELLGAFATAMLSFLLTPCSYLLDAKKTVF